MEQRGGGSLGFSVVSASIPSWSLALTFLMTLSILGISHLPYDLIMVFTTEIKNNREQYSPKELKYKRKSDWRLKIIAYSGSSYNYKKFECKTTQNKNDHCLIILNNINFLVL